MVARSSLLAVCLFWLAYESHFSPSYFADNVEFSITEIKGGLDAMLTANSGRPPWQTAAIPTRK